MLTHIIIPVYRGFTATQRAIESVFRAKVDASFRVVVIDDATPEPAIATYLDKLASTNKITLIRNTQNAGFVVSCNLGIAACTDGDVVLLNSDTEVSDGWLDRMIAAAKTRPMVASVSPFSNNASIASYPKFGQSNQLPSDETTATLAARFASVNHQRVLDIPTAVGFCMLMTRAALTAVGTLDESAFGRGYGEENDWCLRAARLGFAHLLCADAFVYHEGEVSFGIDAEKGRANAEAIILERYPHYHELIGQFVARDPLRPLRRQIDWQRLSDSTKPKVLMLTHDMGGGVERHIRDLIKLMRDDAEVIIMRPAGKSAVKLEWAREGEEWSAWYATPSQWADCLVTLRSLNITRVHIHHIHGLPNKIRQLANDLGVPYDITLHDHWPLTPNYHLASGGVLEDASAAKTWRDEAADFLQHASRVFVPSVYLRDQIARENPALIMALWPHPQIGINKKIPTIKVGVIGRMSPSKGLDVVVNTARYAKSHDLPIYLQIIGPTTEPIAHYPALPLSATGSYRDDDLPTMIAVERPDVLFFPAQIPESFSYTLGTALDSGLPIVASRLGAFTERLHDIPHARLLPWDVSPKVWCDALIEMATQHKKSETKFTHETVLADNGYTGYVSVLKLSSTKTNENLAPRASAYYPVKHLGDSDELPMADLFRYGVECGQDEARTELKRRSRDADILIQAAEARRAVLEGELRDAMHALNHETSMTRELSEHIKHLDREIADNQAEFLHALDTTRLTLEHERDAARAAFDEMSSSTSWKLTAPLRSLMHGVKQVLSLGKSAANSRRTLPHQIAVAKQILREEGAAALGKRVHEKLVRRQDTPAAPVANYQQEPAILPLVIATSSTPQVSIIIPVYGQHVMTYTCLKSIAETCVNESIEIIVIDDCSPEPAADALASVAGISVVRNDTNLGFLKNCNKAAAMARGDFVLILNNDIIVTPGWLAAMRDVWQMREDVGMVGAKLIYPDGRLQEAGGIVWRDGSAWNWGRNQDASLPAYNYLREVDYTSGACLLLKRDFWNQLGGFDERYVPAYYEDTDLAFRVREAGKKVFYQPRAVVVHFEGQSSGTDVTQGVKKHQVTNQQTFLARWRHVLSRHRINGLMPQLERDRYAKRRVLVVDACMLTPDQDSGSLRMFEMLGVMAKLGAKVTFVADNLEYREPYVSQIQALGVEVMYHPVESNITRYLQRHAAEYDVIFLSRVTVAVKHVDTIKESAPRAKLIFDTVDLHFLRQSREAELANDAVMRAAAERMKVQELAIMAKSDTTLVVSPVEEKLLGEIAPEIRVGIVSNIHVNMPGEKSFHERSGVIFIGGFRHPPNLDAVTWYVENVLPLLRQKLRQKNAKIVTTVIGSNAPPQLQKFAADDFVIAGFVPDVAPYYDNAKLSISPLRYGAGVKGKVNISMQYGVPVIATSPSVEGMYLRDGIDVLRADTAEAFADAIIRADEDEALWKELRTNGLQNIETYFSRTTAQRALAGLLEISEG
jgi:O-antigen biosynthesis protein